MRRYCDDRSLRSTASTSWNLMYVVGVSDWDAICDICIQEYAGSERDPEIQLDGLVLLLRRINSETVV